MTACGSRNRYRHWAGKSGADGTFSDIHVISIVWLVKIGDFRSKGNFPSVPRHRPPAPPGTLWCKENPPRNLGRLGSMPLGPFHSPTLSFLFPGLNFFGSKSIVIDQSKVLTLSRNL